MPYYRCYLPPIAAHIYTFRVNDFVCLLLNNVTREQTARGNSHTERQTTRLQTESEAE